MKQSRHCRREQAAEPGIMSAVRQVHRGAEKTVSMRCSHNPLSPFSPPAACVKCVMGGKGHFQSKSCFRLISKHFLAYYAIYHDENYIELLKAKC